MDNHATQIKRRRAFVIFLAAVALPALAVAIFPSAQAEETVVATAGPAVESTTTTAPTTTEPTTTEPPATAPPATVAQVTTTVVKPKATTTTTAAPVVTAPPTTVAPPPAPAPVVAAAGSPATASEAAFLACVRQRESHGNYQVVSANGLYYGAYQFLKSSWDSTARHAGRPDLVGIPPNQASPADQDALALDLLRWQGKSPWGGAC